MYNEQNLNPNYLLSVIQEPDSPRLTAVAYIYIRWHALYWYVPYSCTILVWCRPLKYVVRKNDKGANDYRSKNSRIFALPFPAVKIRLSVLLRVEFIRHPYVRFCYSIDQSCRRSYGGYYREYYCGRISAITYRYSKAGPNKAGPYRTTKTKAAAVVEDKRECSTTTNHIGNRRQILQ